MVGNRAPMPTPADASADRRRPAASVLVCTTGREDLLADSLRTIAAALGPDDELVVVEAGTDAGTRAIAELGHRPWRVIAVDRAGKSRQLNAGIRAARGEVVLVTDDDCRVPAGWVDGMVSAFAEPDVGIAFGPVRGLSEIRGRTGGGRPAISGPAPREFWAYSHGAAMAVRADAVFDVGGFDERLGPGARVHGEEADLVLRMEAAGWRCWIADAPEVDHAEWRTAAEDLRNRLTYERGAGAWLGAALRRQPRAGAEQLRLRLRYQAALIRDPAIRAHGLRAASSFVAGLVFGLRLGPRRFLEWPEHRAATADRPAGRSPIALLPWPAVRDRRCLALASAGAGVSPELLRRGAREVIAADPSEVDAIEGAFDVVVAQGVLAGAPDPAGAARLIRSLCEGSLLSLEPIDPVLTLLARRRPVVRPGADGDLRRFLSGAAHRMQLESAGFEIQSVSSPFRLSSELDPSGRTSPGVGNRLAAWVLTGERSTAPTYRAILCRPRR